MAASDRPVNYLHNPDEFVSFGPGVVTRSRALRGVTEVRRLTPPRTTSVPVEDRSFRPIRTEQIPSSRASPGSPHSSSISSLGPHSLPCPDQAPIETLQSHPPSFASIQTLSPISYPPQRLTSVVASGLIDGVGGDQLNGRCVRYPIEANVIVRNGDDDAVTNTSHSDDDVVGRTTHYDDGVRDHARARTHNGDRASEHVCTHSHNLAVRDADANYARRVRLSQQPGPFPRELPATCPVGNYLQSPLHMAPITATVSSGHTVDPLTSCVDLQPSKLEGNYSTNSILLQAGITHHSQAPFTQPSNYDPTSVKTTAGVNSPHIIHPPPPPPPCSTVILHPAHLPPVITPSSVTDPVVITSSATAHTFSPRQYASKSALFCPAPFAADQEPRAWVQQLILWFNFNGILDDVTRVATLGLLLKGPASLWLRSLKLSPTESFDKVTQLFLKRFTVTERPWENMARLWQRRQLATERAADYISDLLVKAEPMALDETTLFNIALNGVHQNIRQAALLKECTSIDTLLQTANLVETTADPDSTANAPILNALTALQQQLTQLQKASMAPVRTSVGDRKVRFQLPPEGIDTPSPTTEAVDYSGSVGYSVDEAPTNTPPRGFSYYPPTVARLAPDASCVPTPQFQQLRTAIPDFNYQELIDQTYSQPPANYEMPGERRSQVAGPYHTRGALAHAHFSRGVMMTPRSQVSRPNYNRGTSAIKSNAFAPRFNRQPNRPPINNSQQDPDCFLCSNCATVHSQGLGCPAFGNHCGFCGKRNHLSQCCRSKLNQPQ